MVFKLKNPTRKFITTVNRLQMEHRQFRAHLKKIKLVIEDSCRYCTTGNIETLDILECGTLNLQRIVLTQQHPASFAIYHSKLRYIRTIV